MLKLLIKQIIIYIIMNSQTQIVSDLLHSKELLLKCYNVLMDEEISSEYHKKIGANPEMKVDSKYLAYHTALISLEKLIKIEAGIT